MTALKNLGKLDVSDTVGPVVVLVMDKDTQNLGRYQKWFPICARQASAQKCMSAGPA